MTEHLIEAHEDYLRALRTGRPQYPVGAIAVAGFYKARYPGKDSPWCAVKIAERYELDPETGEQASDSVFDVTVNGRPVAATEVWPNCGRFPISLEDYKTMTQGLQNSFAGIGNLNPPMQHQAPSAILPSFQIAQPDRMQSDDISGLAKALAKAQGEVDGALKDSSNPHFKTAYADLASVWGACRKALSSNGLSVTQTTKPSDGTTVTVVTQLMHESGQWLRGELTMRPMKADPQGIGSCITYARRYALAAMVGVAPEDDDGEGASGRQTKPEPRTVSVRDDDKTQRAFEYANFLAGEIDKITSPGYLAEFLADPEHKPKIATLQANYPDAYKIVQNARERKAGKLTKAVA